MKLYLIEFLLLFFIKQELHIFSRVKSKLILFTSSSSINNFFFDVEKEKKFDNLTIHVSAKKSY
jgi:hypothetical protein